MTKLKNHSHQNLRKMFLRKNFSFSAGSYQLDLGPQTKIMGIINITPDSFSQDGCITDKGSSLTKSVKLANKMIREGADILDIGGESTRPGSNRLTAQEEIKRVMPTINKLAKTVKVPLSIDTYKPLVAKQALDAGASIVNNIMGTNLNKSLLKMIKNYNAGVVLMHISGTPKTMQRHIKYNNVISDILNSLKKSIENCLEIGIKSDRIIVDPGIGFGKTVEHNLEIINRLEEFQKLNKPLLLGTSRKSFIGKILNTETNKRLHGTLASVAACIIRGAHIVRVHDVKQTKETVQVTDAIINESY